MRFLREHYAAQKFVTADQLKTIRDGKRLSIAGLVLIRQRPGSAKGVVFITIEDETGVANLVVWPDVFEKQRKIVMGARLMAVHGIVQRDEDDGVIHVVARRLEDHSHMLRHLSDDACPRPLNQGDGAGSWRRPPPAATRATSKSSPKAAISTDAFIRGNLGAICHKIRLVRSMKRFLTSSRLCYGAAAPVRAAAGRIEGRWANPSGSVIAIDRAATPVRHRRLGVRQGQADPRRRPSAGRYPAADRPAGRARRPLARQIVHPDEHARDRKSAVGDEQLKVSGCAVGSAGSAASWTRADGPLPLRLAAAFIERKLSADFCRKSTAKRRS